MTVVPCPESSPAGWRLSPSLDQQTRRAAVEIEIDNTERLLPNMFARGSGWASSGPRRLRRPSSSCPAERWFTASGRAGRKPSGRISGWSTTAWWPSAASSARATSGGHRPGQPGGRSGDSRLAAENPPPD